MPRSSRPLLRLAAPMLLGASCLGAQGNAAWAQDDVAPADGPRLTLQLTDRLTETLPPAAARDAPSYVSGARIEGVAGGVVQIEGGAELRRHDTVLRAERIRHDAATDSVLAEGQVRINRRGNVFEGPRLQLRLDTFVGQFDQPRFQLLRNQGLGEASRLEFLGEGLARAHDVRYSTCPRDPGGEWMPDWVVSASSLDLDEHEDVGVAHGGVLRFKGVPLLAAPYLSFPLSDQRKSGVLPPTINLDSVSGLEVTAPYYLNLAPELDATLYPTVMSRRGVDLGGELRYLAPRHQGVLRASYMPNDRLRDDDRWATSLRHSADLGAWSGLRGLGLSVDLNRVSDDNYWRDFPRTSTSLTSRLLPSNVALGWRQGGFSGSAGVYAWQTLQDPADPITPPFDRLPSMALRYDGGAPAGLSWSAASELTRFRADVPQVGNTLNGTRLVAQASVARRWEAAWGFVEPRLQLHATRYQTETAMGDGRRQAERVLPSFSVDSGLVFERSANYFGRALLQTLEPRAFLASTPYREQRFLPNYDAAAYDFNLDTIYGSNPYGGQDRIADLKALTLGITSRLIDPASGAEVARVGVAQRLRLADQRVVLPGEPVVSERLSDILLSANLHWDPRWSLSANVQFNPKQKESVRNTVGVQYSPGNYRVLSAAYRLQRGSSEQIDLGWQWPLSDLFGGPPDQNLGPGRGLGAGHWYSVGRVNYSMLDNKIVDLVAGFEYDAGCWLARVVVERLQQGSSSANQRILFQLEFSGFSRLGSNPLQTLRDNVPRYQYLREEVAPPSRFGQYD